MAKRGANTDLNHDNWDEEEEAEEAGTFAQADQSTLKDRVIKKAKRRGVVKNDGGPSIFAGFGGFKSSSDASATTTSDQPSFDFLKSSSNGSSSVNFSAPPATSSFAFGAATTKAADNASFSFGKPAAESGTKASFSFGNGSSSTDSTKPASSMFAFGSSNLSSNTNSTFSLGTKNDSTTKESKDEPAKKTPEAELTTPISNPLPLPKTSKWSCPVCMVPNDADKEACVCCSEPKPGAKPTEKASEETKEKDLGTVTSSGFKFGATPSTDSSSSGFKFGSSSTTPSSTGFTFGTKAEASTPVTKSNDDTKEYSKEYLSHLKALNTQVCQWIKTHVEKNPYVFLTPVFKDYEKHLKDLEAKNKSDDVATSNATTPNKPLLGGVFATEKTPPAAVQFGSGSGGFSSFGAAGNLASSVTTTSTTSNSTSFTFGSSGGSGFAFGKSDASAASATDKPDASSKTTGLAFGSSTATSTSTTSTFSFGSKSNESSGFSFGSKPATTTTASTTGFSFGSSSSTGFSFGSSVAPASGAVSSEAKDTQEEEESDEPPKVEVKEVVEDDAFHSVRCKLFYKKEKEFKEKGLGMLHLKKVDGNKTQMVVRAETNLGNILLNILVSDKMSIMKRKNNIQFGCVPNPPIPGLPDGPAIMLLKVKDSVMADELEEKINEAIKANDE